MQQIKLTEYTESYAVSIEDGLPEESMAVFFKIKNGWTFRGEYYKDQNCFESKGMVFKRVRLLKWHPVTVDM